MYERSVERTFLKDIYMGADGNELASGLVAYLQDVLANRRWESMSDHSLYLQGAKQMLEEIIDELELVVK
jgi:hypothetical protein